MGHDKISVLNGGLPEWIGKGFPTEHRKAEKYEKGDFKATLKDQYIKSYQQGVLMESKMSQENI